MLQKACMTVVESVKDAICVHSNGLATVGWRGVLRWVYHKTAFRSVLEIHVVGSGPHENWPLGVPTQPFRCVCVCAQNLSPELLVTSPKYDFSRPSWKFGACQLVRSSLIGSNTTWRHFWVVEGASSATNSIFEIWTVCWPTARKKTFGALPEILCNVKLSLFTPFGRYCTKVS